MLLRNTIKLSHLTLRLVPKVLVPIDMSVPYCKPFWMIDPVMHKGRDIQDIARLIAVAAHHAVGNDLLADNPHQRFAARSGITLA